MDTVPKRREEDKDRGVFGDTPVESVSVMEGDSVTLNTNVTKGTNDSILWYFNNVLIALINGHPNTSCLYDGEDGRFRDRLEVDYETGSLTITNITTQHTGPYEADFIMRESPGKSQSLNRNHICDGTKVIKKIKNFGVPINFSLIVSARATTTGPTQDPTSAVPVIVTEDGNEARATTGPTHDPTSAVPVNVTEDGNEDPGPSPAAVAGIVGGVVVLLLAAAGVGVIYYRRRNSRNAGRRNNEEVLQEEEENSFL